MPTHEAALIAEARRVTRAQARIKRLNRELLEAKAELKTANKNLRALARGTKADPFDQTPPIKGLDTV